MMKLRYVNKNQESEKKLLFLPGIMMHPKEYDALTDLLSEKYHVVSPEAYGRSNLKESPKRLDECVELVHEFCENIDFRPDYIAGHSLGGAITFLLEEHMSSARRFIGLNALLPVKYGAGSFFLRGAKRQFNNLTLSVENSMDIFLAYGLRTAGYNLFAFFDRPVSKLIKEAALFDYSGVYVDKPSLFLHSGKDEYFKMDENNRSHLNKHFSDLEIRCVDESWQHDWMIYYPKRAFEEIDRFIQRPSSPKTEMHYDFKEKDNLDESR